MSFVVQQTAYLWSRWIKESLVHLEMPSKQRLRLSRVDINGFLKVCLIKQFSNRDLNVTFVLKVSNVKALRPFSVVIFALSKVTITL